MTKRREYADFDLLIQQGREGGYRAHVLDSPAGEARGTFASPFSELELENFLLRVGRPRQGTRRLESPEMEAARQFGGKLYEAVFHDDVRLSLRRSIDEVERRGEGLRIRLRFSDTPELASLPWEYLFSKSTEQFLALSAWTPIVRYLDLTEDVAPLTVTGPLRILVMISGPEDYPQLNVEDEWRRIETSLQPLIDRGAVEIERVDDATLLELQRRLRKSTYHVFHYVGHGGFDEKAEDGVLVLEDGNDRSRLVAGRDLGTILQDHRPLQLAVLNACEGARTSNSDPFSGTAQSLVRQGIPAVVAMQFEITDNAAVAFAQEFYAAIAEGLPVDAGISEARRAIFGLGNDIEWGTPVLYLRGDGNLFDIHPVPALAAPVVAGTGSAVDATTVQPDASTTPEAVGSTQVAEPASSPDDLPPPPPFWGRRLSGLPVWGWAVIALGVVIALVVLATIFDGDGSVAPDTSVGPGTTAGSETSVAAVTSVPPTIAPAATAWGVSTEVRVGGKPIVVAVTESVIWVSTFEGDGVYGIDPTTDTVEISFPIGEEADGLAVEADGSLWVVNPKVDEAWHVDPATGDVLAKVPVGEMPSKVALGEGAVWVVNGASDTVSQIDPASLTVVATHPVGIAPAEIVVAHGYVWVSNHESGDVSRIDPSNGSRLDINVGDGPLGLAAGFDSIWVALTFENVVARIDPASLEVARKITVGGGPDGIAAGAGADWVTNRLDDTVSRIDPESETETQVIKVGVRPDGIAVGDEVVWVTVYGDLSVANYTGGSVWRLEPMP